MFKVVALLFLCFGFLVKSQDVQNSTNSSGTEIGHRFNVTCQDKYAIQDDGFTCKSTDSSTPYIIFMTRHEFRGMRLRALTQNWLIYNLPNPVALDFYHENETDLIFWSDNKDKKIYMIRVEHQTLGLIEAVVKTGPASVEGVAVDWLGHNLYWVESNLQQIKVAKLNGSFERILVSGNMNHPRGIAVDPRDGYLFWTDWDYQKPPRIERCSLAGLDRKLIASTDKKGFPNGITIDYTVRRIYWVDAKSNSIYSSNYEGGYLREVKINHNVLQHLYGVTVFENYVYWTEWFTKTVYRANQFTGDNVTVIITTPTVGFDIKILHPSRQPRDGNNPCGNNNGGCSHLCLLHLNTTYKCNCPQAMRLSEDDKTCV